MKQDLPDVLDPPRSKIRALAATVDRHVAVLGTDGPAVETIEGLRLAWLDLSKALDLGAEPALRGCPHCSRRIPCEAKRCRYCMEASASIR
jgi:hypothetical protein